jgi:hypothetical protein
MRFQMVPGCFQRGKACIDAGWFLP